MVIAEQRKNGHAPSMEMHLMGLFPYAVRVSELQCDI